MADQKLIKKLADIPLERPGFDALGMSAPILVQMNPEGQWESCAPESLDEQQLKAVVQHLVKSKAVSAAQSYCCQCAAENKLRGTAKGKPDYVPVIMMPIYPSDKCPFDMECELAKMKQAEQQKPAKKTPNANEALDSESKEKRKAKKRGFVMQRFTDFDLMSQW